MKETEDNSSMNEIEEDIMNNISQLPLPQEETDDWFGFVTYCYCKLQHDYAEFPIEDLRKESDDFDFEVSPLMEEVFMEAAVANEKYDVDHLQNALEYVQKNYHLFYDDDEYDKDDPKSWDDPNGIHYDLLEDAYKNICSKVDTSTFKKLSAYQSQTNYRNFRVG